ncbi:MAG: hypothetical protein KAH20_00075 [Methylococcales bacterium]|nr:hypothetical protein [Methylococcales bacterium]
MNTKTVEFNQSIFTLLTPEQSFLSHSNQNLLNYLIADLNNNKKLLLIAGPRECGKTTLVQRAISNLENKSFLIDITPETLTYEELLDSIGNKLKEGFSSKAYSDVKSSNLLDIKAATLKGLIKTKSIKHIVLFVNQSLKYEPSILKKILKLINSTAFGSCQSHLIVTGSPELESEINESDFPATLINNFGSYQMEPLSENEIRSYINFHLKDLEEYGQDVFSNAAIESIIIYSKGLPGLINNLCTQGLLTANIEERTTITEEVMDEVLENSIFLGNEFDYTTQDPQLPDLLSFNNTESSKQPIEDNQELPIKNKLFQPDLHDEAMSQNSTKKKIILPSNERHQKIISEAHSSNQIHSLKKSKTPVDRSPKTIFIFAFVMGIIATTLVSSGLNFITGDKQDSDPSNPYSDVEPKPTNQQQAQKNLIIENKEVLTQSEELPKQNTEITQSIEPPSSPDRTKEIRALLQRAEHQFINKQLVSPAEDNAWTTYKKILELNPDNHQALSGINIIKETYLGWAKNEISKGNTTQAKFFLNKALEVAPNDTKALEALLSLKKTPQSEEFKYIAELNNDLYKLLDKPNGIPELLSLAQQRITEKNLTTPANNNALSIFKLILSRFPDNKQALTGVKTIKNKYLTWAKHEIKKGNFQHAEYLYTKALEVSPSDPEAQSDLDQLRNTTDNF